VVSVEKLNILGIELVEALDEAGFRHRPTALGAFEVDVPALGPASSHDP
jgi:hypothetical protein